MCVAPVPAIAIVYEGIEAGSYRAENATGGDTQVGDQFEGGEENQLTGRIQSLAVFGSETILLLCCYYPVTTLLSPMKLWRLLLFLIGWWAVFQSGHRAALISVVMFMVLTGYFHRGIMEISKMALLFLPVLLILVAGNGTFFELPGTAQRALSFLPGNWSHAAEGSATASTEWRVEMWKRALTGNKYIKNKVLGDGFGYNRREFETVVSAQNRGVDMGQEGLMVFGQFHSGPVSAIRYVGVLGLVLYYVFKFYLAIYSWKLVRRAKGTPLFVMALLNCTSAIIGPFFFTFLAAGFDGDLPGTILNAGMIKTVKQTLDDYEEENKNLQQSKLNQIDDPFQLSTPNPLAAAHA